MNYETQERSSALKFSCAHCGYGSALDLKECPGCGRLAKEKPRPATPPTPLTSHPADGGDFFNAPPAVAEYDVFVCEHCAYQAFRPLAECPECGRAKFARSSAPALEKPYRNQRLRRNASVNHSELGKFLLLFSLGFFALAIYTFIGYGPSGPNRKTELIAEVGENWHVSSILVILGIASVVAGIVFKSRD